MGPLDFMDYQQGGKKGERDCHVLEKHTESSLLSTLCHKGRAKGTRYSLGWTELPQVLVSCPSTNWDHIRKDAFSPHAHGHGL